MDTDSPPAYVSLVKRSAATFIASIVTLATIALASCTHINTTPAIIHNPDSLIVGEGHPKDPSVINDTTKGNSPIIFHDDWEINQNLVTLRFNPQQVGLSDSLKEVLVLTFSRLDLPKVFALSQVDASLNILAVVSPEDGTKANSIAIQRSKAVRTFLLRNWSALRNAYRISKQAMTVSALPIDSVRKVVEETNPYNVHVLYSKLPPKNPSQHRYWGK